MAHDATTGPTRPPAPGEAEAAAWALRALPFALVGAVLVARLWLVMPGPGDDPGPGFWLSLPTGFLCGLLAVGYGRRGGAVPQGGPARRRALAVTGAGLLVLVLGALATALAGPAILEAWRF